MDIIKRELLLRAARRKLTLTEVNNELGGAGLTTVGPEEWYLWHRIYAVIVENNPAFETMLVREGKCLNWFARALKSRHERQTLS